MNKTYLDGELATPSAVGTMEVITPSTEPVTGRIADMTQTEQSYHVAPVLPVAPKRHVRWTVKVSRFLADTANTQWGYFALGLRQKSAR